MKKIMCLVKEFLNATTLKYIISSVVAFVIDYALLLILEASFSRLLLSMELAQAIAWIVSSQTNFWINRCWVFKSAKRVTPELLSYYGLAGFSFVVKTFVLLEIMCRLLNIPLWIAKPIAEAVMFAINYIIQKKLIFKKKP